MGIQIWTGDQAPQLRMAGTQALVDGISGGINSLGDALEKAMAKKKNESQLATVLRRKHGLLNPERKDDFNMMSLAELQGEDLAFAEQALQRKRRMEEEEFAMRQREHEASLMDSLQRRKSEQGFQESIRGLTQPDNATLGDYFEYPEKYPEGRPRQRTPSLQEILGAGAQHGQLLNPNFDNLMNSLAGRGGGEAPFFDPASIGQAKPLIGPDGKPVPGTFITPTGPRAGQIITDPTQPTRPGQPIQPRVVVGADPFTGEERVTWSGSPDDFRKAFPGMKLPSAGRAALPMPESKAELKKGQAYQTARGVATWDGEMFTPPK